MKNSVPKKLAAIAAILFVIFVLGLLWLAGAREQAAAGGTFGFMALLAFAAGLSMIVLPCTLPLVFIIVPLAAGKDYKRGFLMALLFGLGLTITISLYGVAMAYAGQIFGIAAATPWLLLAAGIAAYLFGFSELKILSIPLPQFSGALPPSLQQKGDYLKSLFLGLLLGNAGIGCPNPLFYVLLFYIAGTADVGAGALLGFIHGAGRALPVILLTILAMFGIQATKVLSEKRFAIEKFTAWLLIIIGAFLIPAGVFNLRGWWILATPPEIGAWGLALGLIILPLVVKSFIKKPQTMVLVAIMTVLPVISLANGGDQRVVEGKYVINLSRSPFTPRVGEKTAMLISFVDLKTNKLVSEDIVVKIRIAKLGGIGSAKREFLFEKKDMLVQGGVLEFPYTFGNTGLHEIFIDFALGSNPQKIYESPDFLMDVQGKESRLGTDRFIISLMLSSIVGVILGFVFGLLIGQRKKA